MLPGRPSGPYWLGQPLMGHWAQKHEPFNVIGFVKTPYGLMIRAPHIPARLPGPAWAACLALRNTAASRDTLCAQCLGCLPSSCCHGSRSRTSHRPMRLLGRARRLSARAARRRQSRGAAAAALPGDDSTGRCGRHGCVCCKPQAERRLPVLPTVSVLELTSRLPYRAGLCRLFQFRQSCN